MRAGQKWVRERKEGRERSKRNGRRDVLCPQKPFRIRWKQHRCCNSQFSNTHTHNTVIHSTCIGLAANQWWVDFGGHDATQKSDVKCFLTNEYILNGNSWCIYYSSSKASDIHVCLHKNVRDAYKYVLPMWIGHVHENILFKIVFQ